MKPQACFDFIPRNENRRGKVNKYLGFYERSEIKDLVTRDHKNFDKMCFLNFVKTERCKATSEGAKPASRGRQVLI